MTDPLENLLAPAVLEALDERIRRHVDDVLAEVLTIAEVDGEDEPAVEAVA